MPHHCVRAFIWFRNFEITYNLQKPLFLDENRLEWIMDLISKFRTQIASLRTVVLDYSRNKCTIKLISKFRYQIWTHNVVIFNQTWWKLHVQVRTSCFLQYISITPQSRQNLQNKFRNKPHKIWEDWRQHRKQTISINTNWIKKQGDPYNRLIDSCHYIL